jgi:signal transduction histidine kinase
VQVALAIAVACFAIGAWSEHRRAVAASGAALVVVTVLGSAADGGGWVAALAISLALVALPIVAGVAARARRRELEEVEARLVDAERRQDEREQLAVQAERNRIARELHDVVAHHVSLIGVQAGAARATLGTSPDATRRALAAIEESSRAAVGEMRQLVEVLQPLDAADRAPQPGLGELGGLVERWRAAGVAVTLDTADVGEVAPTLSASSYRVIEEALTNVARHSTARRASVAVRPTTSTIEIAVLDPGPAVVAPRPPEERPRRGRGLVGMAERAALFGGSVAAGPTADGGFAVLASLPRVGAT